MLKAIQHAKPYTRITQEELDIILHARKTLLFSRYKTWKKPINESLFDIAMESYDGAEICERVSLYILSILGKIYGIQNVGLYLDDGLACLQKINGQASDKIQKDIIWTFRENFSLKITVISNLKSVDFLNVTFNLCTGKYQRYRKPNGTPLYIYVHSNHPPNTIKALPDNISKRISNISSHKATFNNAAPFYNDVLPASGYK